MTSKSHSELYEKIVRDNRSPAIPINLAHLTRVIVQGWKDEGNWPPKGGVVEASIASSAVRRASEAAMGSVHVGRRVRKEIGLVSRARDGAVEDLGSSPPPSAGLLDRHKRLKQGVDSVKRVLRLSGGSSQSPSGFKEKDQKSPDSPKSASGRRSSEWGKSREALRKSEDLQERRKSRRDE